MPQSGLPIRINHQIVVDGVVWRTAANFLRRNIFQREETCGIVAAAPIAGVYKIKRSGKSLNAAKCLKKNIQTVELWKRHPDGLLIGRPCPLLG